MAISREAEPLESRHYVDAGGKYWGAVGGLRITATEIDAEGDPTITEHEEWPDVPPGAVEVPMPPASTLDSWDGSAWTGPAPDVIAADSLKAAQDRLAASPEIIALIEAIAARLSIAPDVLRADVASRLAEQLSPALGERAGSRS